ncbi:MULTISPECIES: bifunctional DNA-binding transcriptional regulator/O6-methylguanine-DNA methyltransferase Ada [unclassified Ruegeria]|uniref:bifunctional DNA-binding transcriptional regulator/O6-methylguanine-DNA methyltransferase Ada n=1 Tax=unclassified Ruegeria TaxID=2625375 RepID=UPI001487A2A4|nr:MULTISPECIES: bifunctional DNA-binding transcriptional regulator/O6-methylguanine-DNA methyltransferase Ada [unclassified Ruegeria]
MQNTEQMWDDVLNRVSNPIPHFYYAVSSTGIYCRTDCPSRRPKRKNVQFFETGQDAEEHGFRACQRCKPDHHSLEDKWVGLIAQACRVIEEAEEEPSLSELANRFHVSPFHFQRKFKATLGVTPKAYAKAHRIENFRANLARNEGSITSAIYDAGYNSSSRVYETATKTLGMTPTRFRNGGKDVRILFAIGESSLGSVLVASTEKGVCALLFGDTPEQVLEDLQSRFPNADLIGDDQNYQQVIGHVIRFVDDPSRGFDLPLDIRGTAFQQRVWEALRDIPAGTTASYRDIAAKIGAPNSFRAVAQACGANNIAVAVPCHRVVHTDGGLSGYRWGIARKRSLLKREAVA